MKSTIEQNPDTGEYFIIIPEDVMESMFWSEGDLVRWHDYSPEFVSLES